MAEADILTERLDEMRARISDMRDYLQIDSKEKELTVLEAKAASPGFWDDPTAARIVIDQTNAIKEATDPFRRLINGAEEVELMLEMADGETGQERETALSEAERTLQQMETDSRALELRSLLGEPFDPKNCFLSIHAGAGGTESCDWANMLYRMYNRYAERHGFKTTVLDYLAGEEAGIKSVTLQIEGPCAYGYLKAERGVHRLVRISPFDSASRRHTSFVALDVTPEFDDEVAIEINEADLRVDTFRASGAGGQHVNTTDSAIRIVHNPSGIVVQCQNERSQHKNRATAMKMLKAKLYEMEQEKKRKDVEQLYGNKGEIAWGHQIRSYVLQPYTMVKDHRTDTEFGNAQAVLDGDLDRFIEAWLRNRRQAG